jgi:hypothetical protein
LPAKEEAQGDHRHQLACGKTVSWAVVSATSRQRHDGTEDAKITDVERFVARLLLSVIWPGGHGRYYSGMRQVWDDAQAGNMPAPERGGRMQIRAGDGSADWAEMFARAESGPVRDRL